MLKRPHRGAFKVSLHPKRPDGTGGRWKTEFQQHVIDSQPELLDTGQQARVVDEWDAEEQRLGEGSPLKQGFGLVLGRFSLGPHVVNTDPSVADEERRHLHEAEWLQELPPLGHAYQWTVLITDPGVTSIGSPGTRSMGTVEVGTLPLPGSATAFVMRHIIPITDEMQSKLAAYANAVASRAGYPPEEPAVLRAILRGKENNGFRWAMELAVSLGFPASALLLADS